MRTIETPAVRWRRHRSAVEAQAQIDPLSLPFSRLEKLLLVAIAVTAIAPYAFNSVLNLWELSIAAFVLLSPALKRVVKHNVVILLLLSTSVLFGELAGVSGLAEKTATLAFLKVCIYVCSIAILGIRCRNADNRRFFLKYTVLPVTLLICLSVWIDLFSGTRFFANWQDIMFFRNNPATPDRFSLYSWVDVLDVLNRGSGLAQRPWHVLAWSMCGLLALLTLRTHGQFKSRWFWVFLPALFFTPLLLPQRNAVVGMATALIVYLISAQIEGTNIVRFKVAVFALGCLVAFLILQPVLTNAINHAQGYSWDYYQTTSLTRLLDTTYTGDVRTIDPRVEIFLTDARWLLENPMYLIFGTGWNIVIAPSTKPHSLYMSVLVGSGIVGLVTLLVFLWRELAEQVGSLAVWPRISAVTKTGLITLAVVSLFDSYMTGRLAVPASFLTLWLALCVIAARRPDLSPTQAQPRSTYKERLMERQVRSAQHGSR